MIKNVFIPEKFGSHYLFPKRVIGFDIGKIHVTATQLLFKGTAITIEKCLTLPLEANAAPYEERASAAIKTLLQQFDTYDAIHTSISSSLVVFKELKLPFTSYHKLSMVIDYEVEPLLPFPLQDAVIDFMITKQDLTEKYSEILVTAVQKQHIANHIQLFAQAGVDPHLITVDSFALYGLYHMIPAYAALPGGVVVLDLGAYSTTILYIHNGQLRLVRGLQKGVLNLAKNSAHTLGNSGQDVMENILRFGLEKDADPAYLQAIRPVFYAFWQEIAFTLSSFTAQSEHHQVINHVLLLGGGAGIKGITSFASQQLGVPCDIFQSAKLVAKEDTSITSKNGFSNLYTMSLSTALAAHTLPLFNLRKKEFARTQDQGLFGKQILTALVLTALLLISLGINSFWQLYTIRSQAQEAEQETVQLLKAQFKIPETDENLEDVVQLATNEVKREQKLWFSFANPGRTPFLAYLLELTNKVDKEDLGFSIDTLRITDTTMIMAAHVKDHAALARLEQELQKSKLFKIAEPKPQTTDFEMKLKLS